MKNLAHAVAKKTMGVPEPLLLPLPPDGTVKTVYIQVINDKAMFAPQKEGPFDFEGLTWQLDPEYGLFINFVFVQTDDPITDLTYKTPLFWLSEVSNNTQSCCIPSIAGTYKFFVNANGKRHDPQIVVTPL
jgi:hypothetical protein